MISSESFYSLNIWKTHQIRSAVTPTVNQSCPMRETQGEPADGAQRSAMRSSDRKQHHNIPIYSTDTKPWWDNQEGCIRKKGGATPFRSSVSTACL